MSDEIKRLMNSADPEDRRRAIRKLAEWRDASALPYLSAIFKTDGDPEIREMASKAGRYIKHHLNEENARPTQRDDTSIPAHSFYARKAVSDTLMEEPAEPLTEQQQAQQGMERAKQVHDDGDATQARQLAMRAFAKYPDLKKDDYYVGLLAQVMDTDQELAVIELVEYIRNGGKKKKKRGAADLDDTPMADMVLYFLLMAVVTVASSVLLNLGISLALRGDIARLAAQLNSDPMQSPYIQTTLASLQGAITISPDDIGNLLLGSIPSALSTLISLFVSYFFINIVGTRMAGGQGTFNGLVRITTPVNILTQIVTYAAVGVIMVIYLHQLIEGAVLAEIYDNPQLFNDASLAASSVLTTGFPILVVFTLVMGVFFVRGVAKNYELSFLEGCGTLIVALMVAGCTWCAVSFGTSFLSVGAIMTGLNT